MREPIVLRGPSEADARLLRNMGLVLLGLTLLTALLPRGRVLLPFGAVTVGLFAWVERSIRRALGRGAVLDEEGVGPALDGERLWTLPWRDYGGYRPARKGGYEILDRGGAVVVVLPLGGSMAEVALAELDLRTPPDGFPHDRYAHLRRQADPRSLAKAMAVALASGGVALGGFHAGPAGRLFVLAPLGLLVGLGALAVAGIEAGHLLNRRRGVEVPVLLPPSLPEEGPLMERHLAGAGRKPLALEEGRRYRTVDSVRRRADLNVRLHGERALMGLAWLFPAVGLLVLILRPAQWAQALVATAALSAMPLLTRFASATPRRLLASVDDVLWVHDGLLIAVRPDGTTFRLPLPTDDDATALRRLRDRGATEVLRAATGEWYPLDRTRLYAAPADLDG